jgi:hypothetical protein
MSADTAVASALSNVPKAVAAGIVDMDTGMLLAIKTTESHPQAVLEMVAAGTKELFEGDVSLSIESAFKQLRGDTSDERYFYEMLVSSKHLIHYFGRLVTNPGIVLVVICRADANLGLVVSKSRELIKKETI